MEAGLKLGFVTMRKDSGKNSAKSASEKPRPGDKAPARSIWHIDEESFGIRVPTTPEHTPLIQELRKASDPFASYHVQGMLVGLSWILPKNRFKGLWEGRGKVERVGG